jgi:hypothetical protein
MVHPLQRALLDDYRARLDEVVPPLVEVARAYPTAWPDAPYSADRCFVRHTGAVIS